MCARVFSVLISSTVHIRRYNPHKHKISGALNNSEKFESPANKKCETCSLFQSIHLPLPPPPIPRKMLFQRQIGLRELWDETGVPGTEAAPQTDSPSSTGRMPSPHPQTNPADPEPSPPRSATSQPRPPARLCRAERWAGNSHCQPHGPHSWGQPAATITASSLWFPSRPVISQVLAPTGTAPSVRDAPVYQIDTRSPLQAPPAPGAPPEPPREARAPPTSPSPFTTSGSPLQSFASLPGFCRTLEGRGCP